MATRRRRDGCVVVCRSSVAAGGAAARFGCRCSVLRLRRRWTLRWWGCHALHCSEEGGWRRGGAVLGANQDVRRLKGTSIFSMPKLIVADMWLPHISKSYIRCAARRSNSSRGGRRRRRVRSRCWVGAMDAGLSSASGKWEGFARVLPIGERERERSRRSCRLCNNAVIPVQRRQPTEEAEQGAV
nr:uncharacterized protein LOC120962461 [Aegilops tauschii subsp. strangulata]